MWMYAYDETHNSIEVRGRGVKIITLLLDQLRRQYLLWKAALLNIKYCFLIYVGRAVHL